jgi:hypothetical protein
VTSNNQFSNIQLNPGEIGRDYLFGEHGLGAKWINARKFTNSTFIDAALLRSLESHAIQSNGNASHAAAVRNATVASIVQPPAQTAGDPTLKPAPAAPRSAPPAPLNSNTIAQPVIKQPVIKQSVTKQSTIPTVKQPTTSIPSKPSIPATNPAPGNSVKQPPNVPAQPSVPAKQVASVPAKLPATGPAILSTNVASKPPVSPVVKQPASTTIKTPVSIPTKLPASSANKPSAIRNTQQPVANTVSPARSTASSRPKLNSQNAVVWSPDRSVMESMPNQFSADKRHPASSPSIPIAEDGFQSKNSAPSGVPSDEAVNPKDIAAVTEIFAQDDAVFDPLADLYGLR